MSKHITLEAFAWLRKEENKVGETVGAHMNLGVSRPKACHGSGRVKGSKPALVSLLSRDGEELKQHASLFQVS
jgi:hypothetical protein